VRQMNPIVAKIIWACMVAFLLVFLGSVSLSIIDWVTRVETREEVQREEAYWKRVEEWCQYRLDHGGGRMPRRCLGHIK